MLRPENHVIRGPSHLKQLALTFDADFGHYDNEAVDLILSTLRPTKARSTFFLTGRLIKQSPEFVLRLISEGHELGNHTYTHPHLDGLSEQEFDLELAETEIALMKVAGEKFSPLWRSPYGEYNEKLWQIAARRGYRHIYWSYDSRDWVEDSQSSRYRSSRRVCDDILTSDARNGMIALFHLGARKNDPIYLIFPELIGQLTACGYRIVTVSDLLS